MTKSNTYSKGDIFEVKTFDILRTVLDNDDFYVSGKKSKIFRKKGYYSEKRKSEIIFDIAIETYLNDSSSYSLLTLIECKNYQSSVPVNDIEEFDSKIRQISEHNTKGIFITNNSFQSGANEFAKSTGIGLVRVNDNDEFEWLVNRKESSLKPLNMSVAIDFIEGKTNDSFNFLSVNGQFVLSTIAELLLQTEILDFFRHKEKFINIPFVTRERVEYIIAKLQSYDVYTGYKLDEKKICNFLKEKYSVSFDFRKDLPAGVLGKIEFDPLKIIIDSNLRAESGRCRFTLAHEIGHLILHSKLLAEKIPEKVDTSFTLSYKYHVTDATNKRLEYQANFFASHLLLPSSTLISIVASYFREERINKGVIYWDSQAVNQQLALTLLTRISSTFDTSIEVARIRLISMGLLIDERYKRVRDVLQEMQLL